MNIFEKSLKSELGGTKWRSYDKYPKYSYDSDQLPLQKLVLVTDKLAYNGAKLAKTLKTSDILVTMQCNNIRSPFEELKFGDVIVVPEMNIDQVQAKKSFSSKVRTVKLRNVKTTDDKLIF